MEKWKTVEECDYFEISNIGRIRVAKTGKIRKQNIDSGGYCYITRYNKLLLIHRLVAKAFLPNPDNLPCINHKDENKTNNCTDNLEWCSYSYNINYGNRNRLAGNKRKRTIIQYDLDGNYIREWDSARTAARYYNVNESHISSCCRKNKYAKTAYGYKWDTNKKRVA